MVFPFITFTGIKGGRRRLSDIEFLSIKEFGNKLRYVKGTERSSTGTLATITANTGKDMYLARAQITFAVNTILSGSTNNQVDLYVNGTIIESAEHSHRGTSNEGATYALVYEFKNIGHKVTAGQIIKLEVASASSVTVNGFIECFEETAGSSPKIT